MINFKKIKQKNKEKKLSTKAAEGKKNKKSNQSEVKIVFF
jgi:hypothetical protein